MIYAIVGGVLVGILLVISWGLGAIKSASVPDRRNTHKL